MRIINYGTRIKMKITSIVPVSFVLSSLSKILVERVHSNIVGSIWGRNESDD